MEGFLYRIDLTVLTFDGSSRKLMDMVLPIDCDSTKSIAEKNSLRFAFSRHLVTVCYYRKNQFQVNEPVIRYLRHTNGQPTLCKDDVFLCRELEIGSTDPQFEVSYQDIAVRQLPKNTVCVGLFQRITSLNSSSKGTRRYLVLSSFYWSQNHNTMTLVAKSTHEIDTTDMALLPCYSKVADPGRKLVEFRSVRSKLFAFANVHPHKQVLQVFCAHRQSFLKIGGSNCGSPGQYYFTNKEQAYFLYRTNKTRVLLFGSVLNIDRDREVLSGRFHEYSLHY